MCKLYLLLKSLLPRGLNWSNLPRIPPQMSCARHVIYVYNHQYYGDHIYKVVTCNMMSSTVAYIHTHELNYQICYLFLKVISNIGVLEISLRAVGNIDVFKCNFQKLNNNKKLMNDSTIARVS